MRVAQALIAPRSYIQGRGLSAVETYVEEFGRDALVVADATLWELARDQAEQSFAQAEGIPGCVHRPYLDGTAAMLVQRGNVHGDRPRTSGHQSE